MDDPINWIKPWLRRQGQRAAVRLVTRRRKTMDGANHVDVDMNNKLKQKLSEEKKSELLMIQPGGFWTAHTLHKAGFLASSACPWCGGGK